MKRSHIASQKREIKKASAVTGSEPCIDWLSVTALEGLPGGSPECGDAWRARQIAREA
jgi:hypothetical protein